MPATAQPAGVRIASTARYLPEKVLTNADLEQVMDTSDEWIVQRTGIRERHVARGDESTYTMAARVVDQALQRAGLPLADLDMLIVATVTPEMTCPSVACRVLGSLSEQHGPTNAGAMDLLAACSGFVYGLNVAHGLIRSGGCRNAVVLGADQLSTLVSYTTEGRDTAVLFGDGSAGAVLRATDDASKGLLAQAMKSDGSRWADLYVPTAEQRDFPKGQREPGDDLPLGLLRMKGRGVFKFAVSTFSDVIAETLERAGLAPDDVDLYVCHQSNVRILEAARERFGLDPGKLYINIDRIGNTSAASVPICLDELTEMGRVKEGQRVMFVAFGGGLTWATSLWQL